MNIELSLNDQFQNFQGEFNYSYLKDLEGENQRLKEENLKLRKEVERLYWILTEQD